MFLTSAFLYIKVHFLLSDFPLTVLCQLVGITSRPASFLGSFEFRKPFNPTAEYNPPPPSQVSDGWSLFFCSRQSVRVKETPLRISAPLYSLTEAEGELLNESLLASAL